MRTLLATILSLLAFASLAADPVPEELAAYQERHAQLHSQLAKTRDDAMAEVIATYKGEMTTLLANIRQQGDLDYVVAIRKELKRLETDPTAPKEPAPKRMKHLRRAQWGARQGEDKVLKQYEEAEKRLLQSYNTSLRKLEKALVAQDRIAEAKTVRDIRETASVAAAEPASLRIISAANDYHLAEVKVGLTTKTSAKRPLFIKSMPPSFAGWRVTCCKGARDTSYTFRVSKAGPVFFATNEVGTPPPEEGWTEEGHHFMLGTEQPELKYRVLTKHFEVGLGKTPSLGDKGAYPLLLLPPGPVLDIDFTENLEGLRITGAVQKKDGLYFDGLPAGSERDSSPNENHDYVYVGHRVDGFPLSDFTVLVDCCPENSWAVIGSGAGEMWPRCWYLMPGEFLWASVRGHASGAKGRVVNKVTFPCPADGKRVKMAVTRKGNEVTVYVDGKKVGYDNHFPTTPMPIYSYGLHVGNTKLDSSRYVRWFKYKGTIRRLQIHAEVLSEEAIRDW